MTKILLVEDDKSLREIYGVRLLAEGYDIVSAGDGEEALAMAIKEKPQLIVSDVMMPKISGFDMLDILRSTTETKNIKVIMMTALSSEDQRQRGEQLGADRYLVKSQVGIEDVVRTVHEVLGDLPGVGTQPTPTPNMTQPAPAVSQPQVAAEPLTAPAPAAPTPVSTTPAPQPTPSPSHAPQQPTPAPQPAPLPAPAPQPTPAATLPQPTAPFSTNRPASLGERIIQPIDRPATTEPAIADRLAQELDTTSIAAPPVPPAPVTPNPLIQQPQQSQIDQQPLEQSSTEGLSFEETPRQTPPAPTL